MEYRMNVQSHVRYHGALRLLIVFEMMSPILCGFRHGDSRIKEVMQVIQVKSHLPAISRLRHLMPLSHLDAFESLEKNMHSPCLDPSIQKYRRPNGLCNNLRNPFQGAVLDTESRMFSNFYLDGRGFPRILSNDLQDQLPSARDVSLKCFGDEEDIDGDGTNRLATQLVWQFGQLLSHDISHVQTFDGTNSCCDNFSRQDPYEQLYNKSGTCYPIEIPPEDPFFNEPCMVFSRAYAVDVFGVREPVNGVTSYIDASTIYGSSTDIQNGFRRGVAGLLETSKLDGTDQLPTSGRFPCERPDEVKPQCPSSGDERLNDQPGLGAMTTMLYLEHNRIARKLFEINRFWDDDRLFLESKKLVNGLLQKIVYEEYLPLLVGNDVLERFNLNGLYLYDESIDTRAVLEFSTAGFRGGHSLINTQLKGRNFSDVFYLPVNMEDSHSHSTLFSMANRSSHESNNKFTSQIRDRLFEGLSLVGISPRPGPSLDLTAININRGRDTGIATYTVVRDACAKLLEGVEGMQNDHLPPCWADGVYRNEVDIDLFVGGVSETPLPGAIQGPTFACLTAIQFQRLKFGDRFFYEGHEPTGFSADQLKFIKRNTLASLMCEMKTDNSLQRDVFRPVSDSNPLVPCSTILKEKNLDEGIQSWKDDNTESFSIKQHFSDVTSCKSATDEAMNKK